METGKKYSLITKISVLMVSFVMLVPSAISPAFADLMTSFPDKSAAQIRSLITLPMLPCIIFTLISTWLASKINNKLLSCIGVGIIAVFGSLSFLAKSYEMLVVFRLLLGLGLGLTAPFFCGFITRMFSGAECMTMLGLQSAASSVGGLLLSFIGGLLAMSGWRKAVLVYLIAVPVLIFELIFIPSLPPETSVREMSTDEKAEERKLTWKVLPVCLGILVYYMMFYIIYTDFTMLVTGKGIGDAAAAGTGLSIVSIGGLIAGTLYSKTVSILKKYTVPISLAVTAIGFVLISKSTNMGMCYAGAFISGCGCFTIMPHVYANAGMIMRGSTKAAGLVTTAINISTFISGYVTSGLMKIANSESETAIFIIIAAIFAAEGILTAIHGLFKRGIGK